MVAETMAREAVISVICPTEYVGPPGCYVARIPSGYLHGDISGYGGGCYVTPR